MGSGRTIGGNDVFYGSFSMPRSIPSGNDMIASQLKNRKSHKKWWIVGGISVFCIALVFLFLFISFQNNEIAAQNLDEINEEVSDFSGIIMYGDGRKVDLSKTSYSDSIDYKFRRKVMEGDQEYINLVVDEFNFVDSLIFEDNKLNLTDEDKYFLEVYGDRLQFIKIYVDSFNEDPLIIINKIIEVGEDGAVSYIETQYSGYLNSNNSSLRDYFTYKVEYEKLAINILSRANIDECITDDSTTFNCEVGSLTTEEEALQLQEIQQEMRIIVATNIKYIVNGCWSIYNIVNGAEDV